MEREYVRQHAAQNRAYRTGTTPSGEQIGNISCKWGFIRSCQYVACPSSRKTAIMSKEAYLPHELQRDVGRTGRSIQSVKRLTSDLMDPLDPACFMPERPPDGGRERSAPFPEEAFEAELPHVLPASSHSLSAEVFQPISTLLSITFNKR